MRRLRMALALMLRTPAGLERYNQALHCTSTAPVIATALLLKRYLRRPCSSSTLGWSRNRVGTHTDSCFRQACYCVVSRALSTEESDGWYTVCEKICHHPLTCTRASTQPPTVNWL